MLPISASVERSASENLVRRFGGEMPTASSSHDGVKGAVFPSLVRAPRVALRKSTTPPPWGVLWPYLSKVQSVDQRMRLKCGVGFRHHNQTTVKFELADKVGVERSDGSAWHQLHILWPSCPHRLWSCLQGTRRKGNVKVRKPGISGKPSAASTDTKARTAAGTSPLTSRLIAVA